MGEPGTQVSYVYIMKISNPRVIPNNSLAYPFQLVVNVDGATTMLTLYEAEPSKETWAAHYSMWKCGFQFCATLLTASKLGNGTFEPKTLRHWKVKEVLLSLRYKAYPPDLVDMPRESATCL